MMFTQIHPKLPMRNKLITRQFYIDQLGFEEFGSADYDGYLMVQKGNVQIHFFEYKDLNPLENYGQVYIRIENIKDWYQSINDKKIKCDKLEIKPWNQMEFSVLDPDNNLLTFGESLL